MVKKSVHIRIYVLLQHIVLSAAQVERHSKFQLDDQISQYVYSQPKLAFRNATVQTVFRIVSAVAIPKTICVIEWDIS